MNDFEEEFQRSGGHKNMNVRRLRDSENRESEDSESSLLWKIWCKEEQRTQAVDAGDVEVGRNGMNSSVFVSYWEHRQRRQWHPNPVLLPGKSHGWRSLVGCSPWGHEDSDMTEQLHFHFSLSCIGEGNGNPLQCSCLENPRDGEAWRAAVHGVTQSRTRLTRHSSSNSRG